MVHFACHGRADRLDPACSQLILADHAVSPLTVAKIRALELSASLSFLSACETATTNPRMADESLHITGAFQIAGYRHVIGTLWSVEDRAAAEIAPDFYRHLTSDGSAQPGPDRSAFALHHATRQMRERYANAPVLWAAHIHTGP